MNWRDLLFDTPWWLLTLIAVIAIALLLSGNKRQNTRLKIAGLVALLLAIGLFTSSWLVDTDVEKVTKRTRQLVAAINDRDWKTFESLLDPKTSFAIYNNRPQLVAGAQATADRIGLRAAHITRLQAKQTQSVITVDLDALSEQDATLGRPMPTSWEFDWQETREGWLLFRIHPLPNRDVTPDKVMRELAPAK